jgi:hypothetical protein
MRRLDCFLANNIPVSVAFTMNFGVPFEIGFNRKPTTAQMVRAYVWPFSCVFQLVEVTHRALTGIDMSAQRTRSRERLCAMRTLMPARHPSHSLTFISLVFDGGGGEGDLHYTSSSVVQCSPQ